jgi:hypothetical protein
MMVKKAFGYALQAKIATTVSLSPVVAINRGVKISTTAPVIIHNHSQVTGK